MDIETVQVAHLRRLQFVLRKKIRPEDLTAALDFKPMDNRVSVSFTML